MQNISFTRKCFINFNVLLGRPRLPSYFRWMVTVRKKAFATTANCRWSWEMTTVVWTSSGIKQLNMPDVPLGRLRGSWHAPGCLKQRSHSSRCVMHFSFTSRIILKGKKSKQHSHTQLSPSSCVASVSIFTLLDLSPIQNIWHEVKPELSSTLTFINTHTKTACENNVLRATMFS